jgi:ribonuclease BN (tRNA processing enzyme)
MEAVVSVLNCGHNCSGFSSSLTVSKVSGGARKVVAICLINAGDSVQKFCNENRIKLKMVTCVFVTSLVPHNVAGLPGLILSLSSLGVETLSIIAPPGIKGLLDVMIPFTNRQ